MTTTEMLAPLRGASFRTEEEKDFLMSVEAGDELDLVREPTNQFDENAIMIMSPDGRFHLGYVGKEFAVGLAPEMDGPGAETSAVVDHFTSPLSPTLLITVTISDADEAAA